MRKQQDRYRQAFVGKKITDVTCKEYDDGVAGIVIILDDGSRHTLNAETLGMGEAGLFLDYQETD